MEADIKIIEKSTDGLSWVWALPLILITGYHFYKRKVNLSGPAKINFSQIRAQISGAERKIGATFRKIV